MADNIRNDLKEMGITLDYGHSKYGDENPAEMVSMLAQSRYAYYIHINDNNAKWDWDYMAGSHNYLSYVEFLYYLQELGYDDFTAMREICRKHIYDETAAFRRSGWVGDGTKTFTSLLKIAEEFGITEHTETLRAMMRAAEEKQEREAAREAHGGPLHTGV